MELKKTEFGVTKSGETAYLYTIRNHNGMEVVLTDFGAAIVKILVPDRDGSLVDVVLGYEKISGYMDNDEGLGAFVARNANRIADAKVTIDGKEYRLEQNDGTNNLHSGTKRSFYDMFEAESYEEGNMATVEFSRLSPDMEQGFPGDLDMTVSYSLTEDNEFMIEYFAVGSRDTVVNLTNHSYFNLSGHNSGSVMDQLLTIESSEFTPTDERLIPTGDLESVEGTPMDFRKEKAIGRDIEADYRPLKLAGGYDHNYVLPGVAGDVRKAASLFSTKTGIRMEVYTDMCGMQVYTANFLNHKTGGKDGAVYEKRDGICFETQFYPNACNEPKFPSSILQTAKEYDFVTVFKFSREQK